MKQKGVTCGAAADGDDDSNNNNNTTFVKVIDTLSLWRVADDLMSVVRRCNCHTFTHTIPHAATHFSQTNTLPYIHTTTHTNTQTPNVPAAHSCPQRRPPHARSS